MVKLHSKRLNRNNLYILMVFEKPEFLLPVHIVHITVNTEPRKPNTGAIHIFNTLSVFGVQFDKVNNRLSHMVHGVPIEIIGSRRLA